MRGYTGVERFLFTLYLYSMAHSVGPDNPAMHVNSFNCHKDSTWKELGLLELSCCINQILKESLFIGLKVGIFWKLMS